MGLLWEFCVLLWNDAEEIGQRLGGWLGPRHMSKFACHREVPASSLTTLRVTGLGYALDQLTIRK